MEKMILDKSGNPIAEKPIWIPYEQYRKEKLYLRAREWFLLTYGIEYNPSREEIDNLMDNPEFIKDTFS